MAKRNWYAERHGMLLCSARGQYRAPQFGARSFRLKLEKAVLDTYGSISLSAADLIDTATVAELQKRVALDDLAKGKGRNSSDLMEIARKAAARRHEAIVALGLHSADGKPIDSGPWGVGAGEDTSIGGDAEPKESDARALTTTGGIEQSALTPAGGDVQSCDTSIRGEEGAGDSACL